MTGTCLASYNPAFTGPVRINGEYGSGNALIYNGSSWTAPASIDGSLGLNSVSCPSSSFCMAVDFSGNALAYNGSVWTAPALVGGTHSLGSVSCPSSSFCAALDFTGLAITYDGSSWAAPVVSPTSDSLVMSLPVSRPGQKQGACPPRWPSPRYNEDERRSG